MFEDFRMVKNRSKKMYNPAIDNNPIGIMIGPPFIIKSNKLNDGGGVGAVTIGAVIC
jgi:hypothetical protein